LNAIAKPQPVLIRSTSLKEDVVRALLLDHSDGISVEFADASAGAALANLASGKSGTDAIFSVDEPIAVGDTQVSAQTLATRFIARYQLAPNASHYQVLGLPRNASAADVRANYRRLISLVHPDTRPESFPEASASQVNLAYATLADIEKRGEYDLLIGATPAIGNSAHIKRGTSRTATTDRGRYSRFGEFLRSRAVLAAAASALAIAALFVLFGTFKAPEHVALVEARPKLKTDLSTPTLRALAEPATAESPSTQAIAALNPPREPAQQNTSTVENLGRESLVLSKSSELKSLRSSRTYEATQGRLGSDYAPVLLKQPMLGDAVAPALDRKTASSKTDDVLVMLVDAVASGQVSQLDALLHSSLPGREKVLNDFDSLFRSTQSREMRYLRIDKFAGREPNSQGFSGQAELALVARDGSSSAQKIYLSGVIAPRDGRSRLVSWSSYPIAN
jgi:hypothetical protein